jgi:hypothetical protein
MEKFVGQVYLKFPQILEGSFKDHQKIFSSLKVGDKKKFLHNLDRYLESIEFLSRS